MKSKMWAFLVAFLLTSTPARAAETPRPIFASSIYNGAGILYIPTSTPLGNRACYFDANSTASSSVTTADELSYVHGVTGPIQAQINAIVGGGISQLTGDGTAGPGSGSQLFTLSNSGVTAGSYTNANIIVDAKGRVTSAANGSASAVTSVFTRTGAVTAQSGDYTTDQVTEGSNLYFTTARARSAVSASSPLVDTAGVFSIPQSSSSVDGYLSATDWVSFNSKQAALTIGNFTDAGTDGITVTGGSGSVIGSGTSISQHVSDATHAGYLSSIDWSTFNGKQAPLTFGSLTAAGTDGISISGGTGAVIGAGSSVAQHVSDSSHSGYLSSSDWLAFNGKQPAGNYLTGTSGDVVSAGPGVSVATLAASPYRVDINFVIGNDTTGTGSLVRPFKSLQKACTYVTGLATINSPYTIHISGGNNDGSADTGAITCPPNTNLVADFPTQIAYPFSITGGFLNDTVTATNINFVSTWTWVRNDASQISAYFFNSTTNGLLDFEQQGAGVSSSFMYMINGGFGNGLTVQASQVDILSTGVAAGTFNYKDSGSAYLIAIGNDLFQTAMQLHGGVTAQLSGNIADAGYSISGTTTGSGTPTVMSDAGSIPPDASITGAITKSPNSQATFEVYSPAVSTNWGTTPSTVSSAFDIIAAVKPLNTYSVDKSGHDSATCGAMLNPCLTISQALTNIGVSATSADVKNAKTVIIGAGNYDESLTIPSGRIISLLAQGMVVLGDGAGANWASTTPRNISWNPQAADLHGSDIKPSLTIGTLAPADATSTFIAESQNFTISGNLTMNGDGTTKTLNLHGVKIWGNISHTDASLVNWQSYRSMVVGTVSTTGNLVLERAYDSRFNGLLSVNAVNMAFNCNFPGGITVQSIQQNLLPNGFFHSNIAGTFTGPANSLREDAATDQYFTANGAALSGGATKVYLELASGTGYTPAVPGNWSPSPAIVSTALDQLAARTSGAVARTVNTISTTFTIPTLVKDYILNANSTSSAFAITLPDSVASAGFCVNIKNVATSPHTLTIQTQSAQTIDGVSTDTITDSMEAHMYCAVGGNWFNY